MIHETTGVEMLDTRLRRLFRDYFGHSLVCNMSIRSMVESISLDERLNKALFA